MPVDKQTFFSGVGAQRPHLYPHAVPSRNLNLPNITLQLPPANEMHRARQREERQKRFQNRRNIVSSENKLQENEIEVAPTNEVYF